VDSSILALDGYTDRETEESVELLNQFDSIEISSDLSSLILAEKLSELRESSNTLDLTDYDLKL